MTLALRRRSTAIAAFALLAQIAELLGRSATLRVDRALSVVEPLATPTTRYYPFLLAGVKVLVASAEFPDAKAMPDAADKLRGQLGDPSVVVLGSAVEGRVALLVSASPGAVERGVKAGAIVKAAAAVVGGGGGGRDTMAQAGGRDPDKLPDAIAAARAAIESALA